jgi:hypothetical protein
LQPGFGIDANQWECEGVLTATADGRFHLIYNDVGDGSLWTTSIAVGNYASRVSTLGLNQEDGRFQLFVENVHFDAMNAVLLVDVRVLNASKGFQARMPAYPGSSEKTAVGDLPARALNAPITGPMIIELDDAYSDAGPIMLMNADGYNGSNPLVDFSNAIPRDGLRPGSMTSSVRLMFSLRSPRRYLSGAVVNVRGHVFIK